jgi:CHAD domain-containing protein
MDEATRHEVRKDAKQFRYSVAFLEPVWPGNHRRRICSDFARHLARLQDSLGTLNDFAVASASRDHLFARCDPIAAARFGSRLEGLLHSRSGSQGKHLRRAEKALDRIADLPAWWKQG